jgi:hypothetical protein
MHAAAASSSPAAAPLVTTPLSAPVTVAIRRAAAACNATMSTQAPDASTIAAATSASITPPLNRVEGPFPFTITGTPSRSNTPDIDASQEEKKDERGGEDDPPRAPPGLGDGAAADSEP